MSESKVQVFRRLTEAVVRRDLPAALRELDPGVRWRSAIMVPLGGETRVAQGHDDVAAMFREFYDAFEEIQIDVPDLRDLGNCLLAFGDIRVRGAASGLETTFPWAYVVEFADGKVIEVRTFLDVEEALAAASRSVSARRRAVP